MGLSGEKKDTLSSQGNRKGQNISECHKIGAVAEAEAVVDIFRFYMIEALIKSVALVIRSFVRVTSFL